MIATCPYGDQCLFASGHILEGPLSDAQADKAVAALQAGVLSMVARNRPPSPTGKHNLGWEAAEAEAMWEPDLLPCPRCDWGTPQPLRVAGRGRTVQGTIGYCRTMRIMVESTWHVEVSLPGQSLKNYYVTRIPLFDKNKSGLGSQRNQKQPPMNVENSVRTRRDQVR